MAESSRAHWEQAAEEWVAWARRPGHDSYWRFGPLFFANVVPARADGGRVLDLGCGEGRVARDLGVRGFEVVALDASAAMVAAAAGASTGERYLRADAARLPFPDARFDLVVAYNSLMDVDDLDGAVAEAARVLRPGGVLAVSVTHPLNDAGGFEGDGGDAPFVVRGSYFGGGMFVSREEKAGLGMTFAGWRHSLEDYMRALEEAGLVLRRLREVGATEEMVRAEPRLRRWARVPLFLHLQAVRPA